MSIIENKYIELSIIIINYNVKNLLDSCLNSLEKLKVSDFEIIVVDNNSTDGSVEMIQQKYPQVRLFSMRENLGFPKANNFAFNNAKGKFLLMLNPDTEVLPGSIEVLIKFLKENENIYLVGPKLLNSDLSHQFSCWRFPRLKYIFFDILGLNILIPGKYYKNYNFNKPLKVDSISGAAILFKADILNKLVGLDEKLFWIEDVDFCYRANKHNFDVYYYPLASIIHHSGESAKKNYNVSISNQVISKIKFFREHGNLFDLMIIYFFSLIQIVSRIIIMIFATIYSPKYYYKWKSYIFTFKKVVSFKNW